MQTELNLWISIGYTVVAASIRFIVAWRPKGTSNEGQEHAVLLADLSLSKLHVADVPGVTE